MIASERRRHHHPAAVFRDVLLVQRLAQTQQHIEDARPDRRSVPALPPSSGVPLMPRLRLPEIDAGSRTLVLGVRAADDAAEHIAIDHDLELLGRVVRPHRQQIEVGLDLHHVIEDQREVLADADVELDRTAGRAVEAEQTVRQIVADGDGGLGADLDPVALVLDLAFVVGVRDRREDGARHRTSRPA